MGRAQVVQAEACGAEPSVLMNPILLKPTTDVGSQVIVNGEVLGNMSAAEYFAMKKSLIPHILRAYETLAAQNDVIVIEGAGSPAEINLKADDIVNMGLAKLVRAPVLLVGDIDRGGVFAQLYGTVALLEPEERRLVKGTVINKFRGDVEILRPGLAMLEELTGVPVAGVLPYLHVDLEDEDSLTDRFARRSGALLDVAVVHLPHISNFTDFSALEATEGVAVRYVDAPRRLGAPPRHEKHGGRPAVDAAERAGGCGEEAGRRRHAGVRHLRRLPDAGSADHRPLRRRRRRQRAGHGAAAHDHGLCRREAPHPCARRRDLQRRYAGAAGRGAGGL